MSETKETLAAMNGTDAVLGMEYNGAEGHESDTVASIIAEMRDTWTDTPTSALLDLADRIEAAAERERVETVFDEAKSALAAPARNCDVGTAEEQAERFKKFCFDHQAPWHGCTNCPELMGEKRAIAWAQMPFATAEGGDHA